VRAAERPGQFLKSDLLTPARQAAAALRAVHRQEPASEPETVAAFGRRRLGAQAVERLLDPFVTGVFGGDIERLELAACFPKLASMEALHGSLFQGMRKRGAKAGALRSFRDGMEELVQALASGLGERLCLRATVGRVEIKGGGFVVHAQDGRRSRRPASCAACRRRASRARARQLGAALAGDALAVPAVGIVSIHLGLPASAAEGKIRGFGYLVPAASTASRSAACSSARSSAHRAPPGMALVRFMLGGARAPQVMGMSDAELVALCVEELRKTTGVEAGSGFHLVHRIPRAIPQYTQGHLARVARVEAAVAQHPGLHLLGASWRGGVGQRQRRAGARAGRAGGPGTAGGGAAAGRDRQPELTRAVPSGVPSAGEPRPPRLRSVK
jgi:oxygen-dependent protoporphyrinogen oxidase